jgi:hypothetical protein
MAIVHAASFSVRELFFVEGDRLSLALLNICLREIQTLEQQCSPLDFASA